MSYHACASCGESMPMADRCPKHPDGPYRFAPDPRPWPELMARQCADCGVLCSDHSTGTHVFRERPSSPAAMLGEAHQLLTRATALVQRVAMAMPAPTTYDVQRVGVTINTAKYELARVCDARREAEAREERSGDPLERRFCDQDGHRWSEGQCVYCGADRVSEESRGGPAVEKAADDNAPNVG